MSQAKFEPPSQIVPFPGCSPIQISNRFANLGATVGQVRPSFQSALISSHDPYQDIAITNPPVVSYLKTSPYMVKSHSHLFVIESKYNSIANPITIAKSYFPPNSHFIPPAPFKNLKYYRDILHETHSITIKPIKDRENPHIILYHSLYIHQIINENEWSSHPYDLKVIQSELQYNYYDYIEAWYSILLHQTVDFSHSWFLNFDSKFKSSFPYWFNHWWEKHGPVIDLFPPPMQELVNYFTNKNKFKESELFFPNLLHFVAKYKVPWIFKWSYQVNWETRVLSRQFSIKWWDKFKLERIADYVYADFPPVRNPHSEKKSSPVTSHFSLPIEGRSKSELQDLARQLMLQASQMNDDADSDASPASQTSTSQPKPTSQAPAPKMRWSDYPNEQDPYDFGPFNLGDD
ncbi:hypothetical protein L3X38_005614 [Prunus dulcis]|uniref:Uncharacterized protein n=1 Tax=Prunus dulcis TaxID=3755 RepID=A0AAD4ZRC8_PRUDU|nr:hypothetical protein L3X38_005614 [Prunus dulcis]